MRSLPNPICELLTLPVLALFFAFAADGWAAERDAKVGLNINRITVAPRVTGSAGVEPQENWVNTDYLSGGDFGRVISLFDEAGDGAGAFFLVNYPGIQLYDHFIGGSEGGSQDANLRIGGVRQISAARAMAFTLTELPGAGEWRNGFDLILYSERSGIEAGGQVLGYTIEVEVDGDPALSGLRLEDNIEDAAFPGWDDATTDGFGNYLRVSGIRGSEVTVTLRPLDDDLTSYLPAINGIQLIPVSGNLPPTAVAGEDRALRAGDVVQLDGTQSFDDNDSAHELQYAWTLTPPAESSAMLSDDDTASPSFTVDVAGNYLIWLVVTDRHGLESEPDEVLVSSNNLAPTADAGEDLLVMVGAVVVVSGAGSIDPEMDPIEYEWVVISKPEGSVVELVSSGGPEAVLEPDVIGVYVLGLTVSDFLGPGEPDLVEVTAVSTDTYASVQIVEGAVDVTQLDAGQVTNSGNQNALFNFLSQALLAIDDLAMEEAVERLQRSIERTDGCVLRGAPDGAGPGRDWVTDCEEQFRLYELLRAALEALEE